MKKVAYIVSAGKGLESFVYREIDEMMKRGIEIVLYTTKYKENDVFSPKKEWQVEKIDYFRILKSFIKRTMLNPSKTFKLFRQAISTNTVIEFLIALDYSQRMKRDGIEHIHAHFGDRKFFIGYYCKKILNLPISVTIHAHEIYANPNEKFFKRIINEADKIVSISEKNKEILIKNYKVNPKKIKVIRLSIDLSNFKKENKIKVLTVARYTERKGFKELFEAIKLLNRDDVEFITVGFGDLDLREIAKKLNIEKKITIFDKMDSKQLRFFYNNCDIFCLPSKTTKKEGAEGIPVVLMEAMASEMLIVTTSNGSISELVDEILVEEGNSESLKEGLEKAIELIKSGKHKEIGKKNREKVLKEYNDNNIDKLKRYLYES
jgi:colanic acid/amylovoran biosynthesis glycosyltransferase